VFKGQKYQLFELVDVVLFDFADLFDKLGEKEVVFVIDGKDAHQGGADYFVIRVCRDMLVAV